VSAGETGENVLHTPYTVLILSSVSKNLVPKADGRTYGLVAVALLVGLAGCGGILGGGGCGPGETEIAAESVSVN